MSRKDVTINVNKKVTEPQMHISAELKYVLITLISTLKLWLTLKIMFRITYRKDVTTYSNN